MLKLVITNFDSLFCFRGY